ncbi:MAG: bifunctional phosphopantothenoylcysteine decarboxylase/phosphopantothenate--cysteine ligase CoaBC [Flammeovirgaceae bacterium]|nr:bifunctional phosphopantothenoylcysteine decarboxylase/phosphopantothenate--cysteine ligase CoaBC [Flammeovirgaceae bacterium]
MLKGKKIILGISGSIAAYKAALLTRLLIKNEAEVQVVMTPSALDFITPLTLSTLSKKPVLTEFTKNKEGEWNNHVNLGIWADALVIAPASANTLAKMNHGICDNLLLAAFLSAKCPVFFAPAMDLDMWQHDATQENVTMLRSRGSIMIKPGYGELASGLIGDGRMAEPEEIVNHLSLFFQRSTLLKGKSVLVTAGPTHEAIDPVRFISNHSTGKMGYAIAGALANCGADVQLVSGPTSLVVDHPNITLQRVTSAEEMYKNCISRFPTMDFAVLAAAVADYKPNEVSNQKIKKSDAPLSISLSRTPDIALELGKMKKANQFIVGFALETENELKNAQKKLVDKNFDLIVLNSLNDSGAGFGHDTNKITLLTKENKTKNFSLKSKTDVANDIVDAMLEEVHA